jgi:hypothetical protein
MSTNRSHECDNCGHEAEGYSQNELINDQGWTWNPTRLVKGVPHSYFIMCDSCNGAAERRVQDRREREQRARVPRANCTHCKAATMVLPAEAVVVGTEFSRALPTSLCRDCDRYPETLRRVAYTPADWAMPDFFFPGEAP